MYERKAENVFPEWKKARQAALTLGAVKHMRLLLRSFLPNVTKPRSAGGRGSPYSVCLRLLALLLMEIGKEWPSCCHCEFC